MEKKFSVNGEKFSLTGDKLFSEWR